MNPTSDTPQKEILQNPVHPVLGDERSPTRPGPGKDMMNRILHDWSK
ncbi:MAG: hypothetical protein N3I86_11685 [Verrucomicrobiae bacterium]|nr:hypothetical protein [Verrucomicrobiae bacterium]